MPGRLAGKIALISGGATGMGGASSRLFAAEGAKVGVVDRNEDAGRAVVAEIERAGGTAVFAAADVANEDQVNAAAAAVTASLGAPNVLFNHAGSIIIKPFLETTLAEWDWLMAVNVLLRYAFSIGSVLSQELEWHLLAPLVLQAQLRPCRSPVASLTLLLPTARSICLADGAAATPLPRSRSPTLMPMVPSVAGQPATRLYRQRVTLVPLGQLATTSSTRAVTRTLPTRHLTSTPRQFLGCALEVDSTC